MTDRDLHGILAVDPGKMTGWARLTNGEFDSGECSMEEFLTWIKTTIIEIGLRPHIVCEDFIYTPQTSKKSRQTWSTESIGVLRFIAREYGCGFTLQSPSDAKSFASNTKLKGLGWWNIGKGHANDAARHLLVYSVKNRIIDPRILLQSGS